MLLGSILKEISPGCSLEGMMLKLKLRYFGHLMRRVDSLEKMCKWLLPRLAADLGNTDVLRVVSLSCGSLAIYLSVSSASFPLCMEFPLGADAACLPTFPPFVTYVQTWSPDRKGLLCLHTQSRTLTGLAFHLWVDIQLRGAGQFSRES